MKKRFINFAILKILVLFLIIPNVEAATIFYEKILDYYGGAETVELKPVPDYEQHSMTNEGLFPLIDDYGMSYYFRGAVDNNWVYFANHYWRIVRINGDNSVKLVYSGKYAPTEEQKVHIEELSEIEVSSTAASKDLSCINDACGINVTKEDIAAILDWELPDGMSYGERDCVRDNIYVCTHQPAISCLQDACSLTYEEAEDLLYDQESDNPVHEACFFKHANQCISMVYDDIDFKTQIGLSAINFRENGFHFIGYMYEEGEEQGYTTDSDIKKIIDKWYEDNLLDYQNYLSDFIVCNDRELLYYDAQYLEGYYPAAYLRMFDTNLPRLSCPNKADAFTVSDTEKGNGALTYPIGLLTMDEVALAGEMIPLNTEYYLWSNNDFWTVSPRSYRDDNNGYAEYFNVQYLDYEANYRIGNMYGVRPTISIVPTAMVTGTGTWNDPYILAVADEPIVVPPTPSKDNPQTGLFLNISLLMLILVTALFVYKENAKYNKFNKF